MKINFIHPPQYNVIDDRLDPPLGLLYIATNIKNHGYYDTTISDFSGKLEKDWNIEYADIYGLTVYSPSVEIVKNIARKCKEINPKCIIVCGGIHATILPDSLLEGSSIDCVVRGYGEYAMLDIIRDYPNVKKIYQGISFDPNLLAIPDRSLIDITTYSRKINGKVAFNIQTTRGCPFACSFCSEHVLTKKILQRSSDSIYKEVKNICTEYGGDALFIYDDIFTLNKTRLKQILDIFKNFNIIFDFHLRADTVNIQECKEIKESGGNMARIGIESFSDTILKKMNKKTTREQNISAIKKIKEAGLLSRIFLIFGFPGENEHTVEETISGIEEANPDQIFLSTFVPFPGCDVWSNPEKYNINRLDKDYSKYSFVSDKGKGNIVFGTSDISDDKILQLQDKMYQYVYSRSFRGPTQTYYTKLYKNMKV